MTTTYPEVLARLFAARRAGIVFGLDRIAGVLAALGHPERRLGTVVHVGGTNGKGSTAALVAAVAQAAGARVGVYTSPHLASLRERFTVDGALADEAAVVEAFARVVAAGGEALTFFEQVTALGLVILAEAAPQITVLEVGLGGRLDATTAVPAPIAAVTGVALDHQDLLGATLAQIADEKAGIWKAGQRAVIGRAGEPEAVPMLAAAAARAGVATTRLVTDADVARAPATALAGDHQRANAACADAVLDELVAVGALVAPADVRAAGYAAAVHPGRLEQVARGPTVVLDGAHNPAGAAALARAIAARPERPRVLVLAISADKDVDGIVAPLAAVVDATIATRYDQPRALAPAALAARVRACGGLVECADDLTAAVDQARTAVGLGGLVVVAGSLFAVGEVRPRFRPMAVDPLVLSDPSRRG
ncbi:MAG: bifunctional folylpolyglutamate synthase/dihydrofolate synthase [Myxococcales bacterium]|nr:bifunctional folylpolyglutamate synthase/dihydrofolate synthase [Myxococcales bacterium]